MKTAKKIQYFLLGLFFTTALNNQVMANAQPQSPSIDIESSKLMIEELSRATLLGDVCEINHELAQQTEAFLSLVATQDKRLAQELITLSEQHRKINSDKLSMFQNIKNCYIQASKTKIIIKDAERKAKTAITLLSDDIHEYEIKYSTWQKEQEEIRKEQERRARQAALEREEQRNQEIRSKAVSLASQLGKYIVSESYGGGSNIGVNLTEYEYLESSDALRMKVQIRWNGAISGESGYAAEGEILAIYDNSSSWSYGKNVKWNPTWQSSKLDDWISQRNMMGLGILGGILLGGSGK